MSFNIHFIKASNGDSFLIMVDDFYILIDFGLESTYDQEIKPILLDLKKNNKKIDLAIITHIDDDHIGGAIKFFEENNKEKIIEVEEVLFNGFSQINNELHEEELEPIEKKAISTINSNYGRKINNVKKITAEQGITLSKLLTDGGYKWNDFLNNGAVKLGDEYYLNNQISLHFLSPTIENLNELNKVFFSKIKRLIGKDIDLKNNKELAIAFENYIAGLKEEEHISEKIGEINFFHNIDVYALKEEIDKSKTNGSSIAFILKRKNKNILFLGDAFIENIIKGLEYFKIYDFEYVKLSHHGSNKNISNLFLDKIKVTNYIISTNGSKHKHPNKETLAKILKKTGLKNLFFNYKQERLNFLEDEKNKKLYNFTVSITDEIVVDEDEI